MFLHTHQIKTTDGQDALHHQYPIHLPAHILSGALRTLDRDYGPDIERTWLKNVPSPLLTKLTISKTKPAAETDLTTEVTDLMLKDAGGIAAFATEHDNAIFDLCERETTITNYGNPFLRFLIALAIIAGFYMYNIGGLKAFLSGTFFSFLGAWAALPWTCKCKVVAR